MSLRHYSRKKRQLLLSAEKLNQLISNNIDVGSSQIQQLVTKIRRLCKELLGHLSKFELIKSLGAAALIFGLSIGQNADAQTFAAAKKNPFSLKSNAETLFTSVVDIDGDNDFDIIGGDTYGTFFFYKNTGTSTVPLFAKEILNPFGLSASDTQALAPSMIDLDDDGDLDLLIGGYYGAFSYYENTGTATSPAFGSPQSNPFGLSIKDDGTMLPTFVDLDGDGDYDLLVGIEYGHVAYFENVGTKKNPAFASPKIDPFSFTPSDYIAASAFTDLDKDGDLDLLVGEYYGNMLYYKNVGSATKPDFEAPVSNPFGITQTYYFAIPAFADFDNDGDNDLMVAEYYGVFQYFENVTGENSGIESSHQLNDIVLSPNPTSDIINITYKLPPQKINIYDVVGHQVMQIFEPTNQISLAHLPSGIYDVRILDSDGNFSNHKIAKQ